MTTAVCPYCRSPIEPGAADEFFCPGCGTPHHSDCFQENGGCTVFGCSAAPAEEQKVVLTGRDLAATPAAAAAHVSTLPEVLPGVGLMPPGWKPDAPPKPTKSAPPPMPPGAVPRSPQNAAAPAPSPSSLGIPRFGSGSTLFATTPMPTPAPTAPAQPFPFDPAGDPNAKNRSNFIVLGVLLGALGAHNFYAGYRNKALAQLLITLLTLGIASPLSWVWAVVDVCTVDHDSAGVKFRS